MILKNKVAQLQAEDGDSIIQLGKVLPKSETARLQKLALAMEAHPALILRLVVNHFPPNTFSHEDYRLDFAQAGLTRAQLVVINDMMSTSDKDNRKRAYEAVCREDGSIIEDKTIVETLCKLYEEENQNFTVENLWSMIYGVKS